MQVGAGHVKLMEGVDRRQCGIVVVVDDLNWLNFLFLHLLPIFPLDFLFKSRDCSHPHFPEFLSRSPELVNSAGRMYQKDAFLLNLLSMYLCQFISLFRQVEGIIEILVADFGPILEYFPVPICDVYILLLKADEK